MIISGCADRIPSIIHVGECEHGVVYSGNVNELKKIFPDAEITDILVSGGCYQERMIKKQIKE